MNEDLTELNLVAGTNISLSRVGETVVVDCTYDYDPTQIEEEVAALDTRVGTAETNINTLQTNLPLKEDKSNLVTSVSSSSTNTQYPSAKLLYDQLQLKQNVSNLVTSVSSSSTNSQYPSAKLLYDTKVEIEDLIGDIGETLDAIQREVI